MTTIAQFASPVDVARYGEYRIVRPPGDERPIYRFNSRVTANGSSGFRAEPGRYHLYAGWFCPWSHRVTIQRALNGLEDVVSVSYLDDRRDARGWAFRERYGPDPVNGFTLLRDAYEATEPGFDGHVSVPTLWDRETRRVISNNYRTIGIDLASEFGAWRTTPVDTYPIRLRADIEELDRWIGPSLNQGVSRAGGTGTAAEDARAGVLASFTALDDLLSESPYLVGDSVTEADVRLYVTLVRYDVDSNDLGQIGPPLSAYPNLADYAARLYALPAFAETTDFHAYGSTALPSFLDGPAPG